MTAKRVDAAVEAIVRRDPSLREWAQVAADGLTAGEGEEALRQAFVQDFLWYRLPAKYPERAWLPVARVAAALLGELALERYAAIAASDTTRAILDAWREDPTRGFARYRAAVEASGVKPPDTDLLAWASVMGFDEASAYARLETTLEEAIMAGRFASGASGWKSRAASLTEDALREPPPHDGRRSWLEMILSERRRAWVEMAHPEGLRRWRAARADEFTGSTDPPDDLEPVVGAMRWLLETCRDRVELTQSGYLSPSIVREGVELFDWWDWPGQPRSEVDVHQLGALRETAARLRLVTRRGRRLGTSRHGVALLEDPSALWRAVATTIGATDDYAAMLSELIAHRLLAGPALGDELEESIVPVVAAQEIGEGVEHPVGALPLRVGRRRVRGRGADMPLDQSTDPRRPANLGLERLHRWRRGVRAQDVGHYLPADRRLLRREQVIDDRSWRGRRGHIVRLRRRHGREPPDCRRRSRREFAHQPCTRLRLEYGPRACFCGRSRTARTGRSSARTY